MMSAPAPDPAPTASPGPARRVALVVGATGGLGRACALALAARGYGILAVARTPGALDDLKEAIEAQGGWVSLAVLDLADTGSITAFMAILSNRWERLDLVIHAAVHATPLAPVPHIDPEDLARSLQVNVLATAQLVRHSESLLDANSTVLFFEDIHEEGKFAGSYGSSKAAQIALARRWQQECQRIGPRIHILQPRRMATRSLRKRHPGLVTDSLASPTAEAERLLDQLTLAPARTPDP